MNKKTLAVFHALMKKGWIDRQTDHAVWAYSMESDVAENLKYLAQNWILNFIVSVTDFI